jgi:hypothetical protein
MILNNLDDDLIGFVPKKSVTCRKSRQGGEGGVQPITSGVNVPFTGDECNNLNSKNWSKVKLCKSERPGFRIHPDFVPREGQKHVYG